MPEAAIREADQVTFLRGASLRPLPPVGSRDPNTRLGAIRGPRVSRTTPPYARPANDGVKG
jgi:hypothetical protein